MCRPCHDGRKKLIEQHGFDDAIGIDGLPLDPRHPFFTGHVPKKPPRPSPITDVVGKLIPK